MDHQRPYTVYGHKHMDGFYGTCSNADIFVVFVSCDEIDRTLEQAEENAQYISSDAFNYKSRIIAINKIDVLGESPEESKLEEIRAKVKVLADKIKPERVVELSGCKNEGLNELIQACIEVLAPFTAKKKEGIMSKLRGVFK
eukprot:TRINITY_DN2419_c0_g1_i4.p1 TRINITY_DN2419_c0_g1~~TRINITY_DN2419_c0_g1_i4.p1  ORF type:complete len:142 (+),score=28.10 TRINITY_DN2419_c0_g1_i4:252-677(+)